MSDDKKPFGRPSKYDPKFCDMIIEHMSEGASMASFAAEIEVARSTINKWGEDHPDFSEAISIAKSKCAAWWEKAARSGALGSTVSASIIIFGLKNMAPDDWRDKQEIEQTSTVTNKPAIDYSKLSKETLEELRAQLGNEL